MNIYIKALLISLSYTCGISLICAVSTYLLTPQIEPNWFRTSISAGVFVFITFLQLLFGQIYNTYIRRKNELHLQMLQRLSNMTDIILTCAYCNKPSDVTIDLTQDNSYTCPKCNNINKIIIQYYTSRITVPLIEKVDAGHIIEENAPTNIESTIPNEKNR